MNIWKVIQNGNNMKRTGRDRDGRVIILPPTTAEEHIVVQRESKAITTLLQSIPDDHMRKSMLKQEFSEFRIGEAEGLHKGYDMMQKILSSLNLKKGGLELLSFDDLYYKLKTLEVDVKGYTTFSSSQSAAPSHSAFVSATSASKKISYEDSPSYSSNTTYSASSNSKSGSHRSSNVLEDVLQSFVADTEPEQQLAYEDFEQTEKLDLEEMDLKWQMAMLSVRVHKFEQKAGRKIDFDKKESARFNKKKVRCYKCQQRGHFARECRAKGGNDKQRYSSFKIKEIGNKEEYSKALITVDILVDWTYHDDECDEVITAKEFGMIAGCDSENAIEEGALKIYNLITGADKEEASTAGDAGEFALMGVTSEDGMTLHLVFFTTTSEDVEGRPIFHRFAKADSMKAVPPPLSRDYTSLSDHIDLDESQMSYGTKSSTSCDSKYVSIDFVSCDDSDKSLDVNTNDFASSDSSVKSSDHKPNNSISYASTSSHKNTSRTSCNKNGYVNNKAGHFRKNASSVSKLCFVCGSGTHFIKDCDFYEKQMANKTVVLTGKPKVFAPVPTGKSFSSTEDEGIFDSGCSRSMTGNKERLDDFQAFQGGKVTFGGDTECLVLSKDFKLLDDNMVVLRVPRKHNLYTINLNNLCPKGNLACLVAHASFDESVKWHRRIGHVNYNNMNRLVNGNLVRGLPPKLFKNDHTCVACYKGKQHKASYKAINAVFFLEHKDETYPILKDFINLVENLLNKKVKAIRCDNGTEFKNAHMIDLCGSKGIKMEYSNPRTPQQNGVAERKNRTLIEAARTMLANSKLPTMFWTEAVRTTCYVLNRVSITNPHNKTPYALLTGRIPSVIHFKPFGCHVTILNTSDHLGKFDGKADEGYIVGYSASNKAYRVYNVPNKIVEEYMNLRFLEEKPNVQGTQGATTTSAGTPETDSDSDYDEQVIIVPSYPSLNIQRSEPKDTSGDEVDDSPFQSADEIFQKELARLKDQEQRFTIPAGSIPVLADATKVSTDDVPVHTSSSTDSIFDDEPTTRFYCPSDLGNHDPSPGIFSSSSYDDEFGAALNNVASTVEVSPVAPTRIHTIHPPSLIIGDPTSAEEMQQFKFQNVWVLVDFPEGKIDEEVYVTQPKGFMDPQHLKKAYKVVKALYGLHQAPRAWYATLSTFLLKHGYKRGTIDKTLFLKKNNRDIILVQVYVDDIIFRSTKKAWCDEFEALMKGEFQMSAMRELTFFLGSVRTSTTPYEAPKPKSKNESDSPVNVHLYRSMICSLMYLTASRPDIMFVVSACLRHQVTPTTSNLEAVKKIFKYLKGQPKLGLWYPKESPLVLEAYSDSDYAGANKDRKSTTGGYQFLVSSLHFDHQPAQNLNPISTSSMAALRYKDEHKKVGYMLKPTGSDDYHQIIDFLRACHIRYALTHDPIIFDSLVKQFWSTATLRAPELGPPAILATIDKTPYNITEDLVRSRLQLADDGGIADLPIGEIYSGMDNLGYVTEGKLTFFKNKFSPQWRFLVHTLLHCLSTKSGSWDQFGSPLAVALIFLSDGRRFNWQYKVLVFSSKLFANMRLNFAGHPMPLLPAMLLQAQAGEGAEVAAQVVPQPVPAPDQPLAPLSTPSKQQTSDPIALVLEQGQSSDPHIASFSQSDETDAGPFTTVEDAPMGGDFHTSPPRSSQAPPAGQPLGGAEDPITLTTLSFVVSTLVQRVHSLESELKDHKKLFKDVVGKLVKKVKALEVKLKTKKRKMVMSDSDLEDDGQQDMDLDALRALANAAVTVDSNIPFDGTSQIPAASPSGTTAVSPGTSDVPPGTSAIPTAASTVPAGSPNVPTDVPSSVAPAGVSSKGKSPMLEEDIPVTARTFKQMEEDRLGKEAAKRLHDEEMAQMKRQRAEVQRKRQQDVLDSAMYYNEADWLNISAQVEANASLSKTLLGDDVSEDNFPARMTALIKRKRQALVEKLAKERQNWPMTQAQQKPYMRQYVENQSSAIYNTGWTMAYVKSFTDDQLKQEFEKIRKSTEAPIPSVPEVSHSPAVSSPPSSCTRRKSLGRKHILKPKSTLLKLDLDADAQTFIKVVVNEDSDDEDFDDEVWSAVVGWEVLPTPLGKVNALYRIDGSTKHFTTLRQILHMVDRQDLVKLYGLVEIRSWRLYTLSNVHVLETVSGEVLSTFTDVSYHLLVKLMEQMLMHKLEIDTNVVGNDMTTAEQLIQFIKNQLVAAQASSV
uniref:Ribonuclease H-like domain-containing protein n=1 Tax=Tanacetum cinerariifolium TaxID=118510 RepID=A0A6L2JP46_TANCI|nr:ribonuclease H-like domain-containing protein [Tanacetum cinerariifolium]